MARGLDEGGAHGLGAAGKTTTTTPGSRRRGGASRQRFTQHARRSNEQDVAETEGLLGVLHGPARLDCYDGRVVGHRFARERVPDLLDGPAGAPGLLVAVGFEGGASARAHASMSRGVK